MAWVSDLDANEKGKEVVVRLPDCVQFAGWRMN